MVARTVDDLYGDVNTPDDIREINRRIRAEMEKVKTQEQLTELKRRSDYLCTLTFSPAWRKRFGERRDELLQVAMEENRETVAKANEIARAKGFEVRYRPWSSSRAPAVATSEHHEDEEEDDDDTSYRRSEERYAGGGIVKWLVYRSPQPLVNGRVQDRVRAKRLYFPADARNIRIEGPSVFENRVGRPVHGVVVRYEYQQAPATAERGGTRVELPERWADRTKVVKLPEGAHDIELTDDPPEGPRMAVA